jgi:hypothetical protein
MASARRVFHKARSAGRRRSRVPVPDERPTTTSTTRCKNCQDVIDPRRAALGYDYCTKPDCQRRHLKPLELVRITVNKASDQYVGPEELPTRPAAVRWGLDDADDDAHADEGVPSRPAPSGPTPGPRPTPARPSTAARLRAASSELDAKLAERYEAFCRNEITAAEMKDQQNALIETFNARVRAANIRYRSFLRQPV